MGRSAGVQYNILCVRRAPFVYNKKTLVCYISNKEYEGKVTLVFFRFTYVSVNVALFLYVPEVYVYTLSCMMSF